MYSDLYFKRDSFRSLLIASWNLDKVLDELCFRYSVLSVTTHRRLETRHNQLQILKRIFIIDDAGRRGEMGAEG
jgi:hypothetical protein